MGSIQTETCANCGATIGAMEDAFIWKDKPVCAACHMRLSTPPDTMDESVDNVNLNDPMADTHRLKSAIYTEQKKKRGNSPLAPPGVKLNGPVMLCSNPHCGYHGPTRRKNRGNAALALVLCLLMLLPGIIYILLASGYEYFCPVCGMSLRKEHR